MVCHFLYLLYTDNTKKSTKFKYYFKFTGGIISKKLIETTLILSLFFFIILIIFDLINITRLIPLSSNYDWLGFIGTFISGIATLVLGIVSIKQNDALYEANKKMISNDMISNCFSKIDIEKINYMDHTKTLYSTDYGI